MFSNSTATFFTKINETPVFREQWKLHKDTASVVSSFLSLKDLVLTRLTCQAAYHELFKKPFEKAVLEQLLKHIARGEEDKAELLLNRNLNRSEGCSVLFGKGKVTDHSGRAFRQITAFQYALWTLNKPMWEMIKNYFLLETGGQQELQRQLLEHMADDDQAGYVKEHERYFSFKKIKKAVEQYIDYVNNNSSASNFNSDLAKRLGEIGLHGGIQKHVPAYVVKKRRRSLADAPETFFIIPTSTPLLTLESPDIFVDLDSRSEPPLSRPLLQRQRGYDNWSLERRLIPGHDWHTLVADLERQGMKGITALIEELIPQQTASASLAP